MAYIEKIEAFKTIFTRGEIGCHVIRSLEKDDVRFFFASNSHEEDYR